MSPAARKRSFLDEIHRDPGRGVTTSSIFGDARRHAGHKWHSDLAAGAKEAPEDPRGPTVKPTWFSHSTHSRAAAEDTPRARSRFRASEPEQIQLELLLRERRQRERALEEWKATQF